MDTRLSNIGQAYDVLLLGANGANQHQSVDCFEGRLTAHIDF
jgi:hypothetical protein